MKKLFTLLVVLMAMAMPLFGHAYTINDSPANDAIGYPIYETYGMNVINYTPGVNSGNIQLQMFTNYPVTGNTTGSWNTFPADIFIVENYYGVDYNWAIPLVAHDGFTPGTMYAVGTFLTSTDVYNSIGGGGYNYNPNVPVLLQTVGDNYGWAGIGGGSVNVTALAGLPDFQYNITLGAYQDDPFGTWAFTWGTATCANDILTGQVGGGGNVVPIPGSLILLGSGLLGMVGLRVRKRN